ncbi:MAG: hypothetical protein VZR53_11710 [Prevotella sp.]|nr:hypothetical protein [Prevotella sp.]
MSINMKNVKAITLGGQNVKKIEDANGNVLWALPSANAAVLTFNSYIVQLRTSTPRYFMISQLTEKIGASTNKADAIKFFILNSQEIQNIQNQTYNQDIVLGHTLSEWQNSPDSYFLCYVLNNEVYMIGNSQNSTANDTVLGTTNDLTYAKHYYPFDYSSYKYVNLVNNSSTGTNVTRWRHSGSYYWINHTNAIGNQNTFTFLESASTTSPYIHYGKEALTNLAISGYTTTFPLNGTFSFGGTAVVTYTDGSTKDVTNTCTISGYDMSKGGAQTVTVTYSESGVGVIARYQINVGTEHTGTYNWTITYTTTTSTVPRLNAASTSPTYTSYVVIPSKNAIIQKIETDEGVNAVVITSVKYYQRYHGAYTTNTTYSMNLRTSYTSSSTISSLPGSSAGNLNANTTGYMYGNLDVTSYLYTSSNRALYWYYTGVVTSTHYYRCTSTSTTSGVGLSASSSSQPTKLEIAYKYYT